MQTDWGWLISADVAVHGYQNVHGGDRKRLGQAH